MTPPAWQQPTHHEAYGSTMQEAKTVAGYQSLSSETPLRGHFREGQSAVEMDDIDFT